MTEAVVPGSPEWVPGIKIQFYLPFLPTQRPLVLDPSPCVASSVEDHSPFRLPPCENTTIGHMDEMAMGGSVALCSGAVQYAELSLFGKRIRSLGESRRLDKAWCMQARKGGPCSFADHGKAETLGAVGGAETLCVLVSHFVQYSTVQ